MLVSFYADNNTDFQDWNYPRHGSQKTTINANHVLASSALPLFFPTIPLDGFHYGDGSIGLVAPLRGAIRFAADRIMILGTELGNCRLFPIMKPYAMVKFPLLTFWETC